MNIPHEIKVIATVAATGVAIVTYIPYLIDMFKGKNNPHLYTWISITIITIMVAYLQVIGGAGIGAIPTILGCFVDLIILFYCFRYGTKDVIFIDKVCLAFSLAGVATYLAIQSKPGMALAIITTAEVVSFFPTFRKTKNDPYSESLTSYYLLLLKLSLILIALEEYNWLTASYPIVWIIVFVGFLISVHLWKNKKTPQKALK